MTAPGLRALLRRHGAAEERARHADAVVHPDGRHLGAVGALRLQPRVRARPRRHRREPPVDRAVVGRRGAERGLRGHDPAPGLHGLPAHVRDHHAGAHHRHVRRADEVLGLPPLLAPLGHADLRPARALGVGRRAGGSARWGALDFAGRHGRPHLLRRLGARRRARDRQAPGLRPRADAAPQPAVHASIGVGDALGRLVRLQRRQRARRGRSRGQRLRHDQHGGGRRRARVDVRRVGDAREADRPRRGVRAPSRGWSRSRRPRASSGRSPRS